MPDRHLAAWAFPGFTAMIPHMTDSSATVFFIEFLIDPFIILSLGSSASPRSNLNLSYILSTRYSLPSN
jgi:hypothetical protein